VAPSRIVGKPNCILDQDLPKEGDLDHSEEVVDVDLAERQQEEAAED